MDGPFLHLSFFFQVIGKYRWLQTARTWQHLLINLWRTDLKSNFSGLWFFLLIFKGWWTKKWKTCRFAESILMILSCSPNPKVNYFSDVVEILEIIENAGLRIKFWKCFFGPSEVPLLGHIVFDRGIKVNENKILSIIKTSTPTSKTGPRSFLGLSAYYRRFVQRFSNIAASHHAGTCKTNKFPCSTETTSEFEDLKRASLKPQVLIYPNISKAFIVKTEALLFCIRSYNISKRRRRKATSCTVCESNNAYCKKGIFSFRKRSSGDHIWTLNISALSVIYRNLHTNYGLSSSPIGIQTKRCSWEISQIAGHIGRIPFRDNIPKLRFKLTSWLSLQTATGRNIKFRDGCNYGRPRQTKLWTRIVGNCYFLRNIERKNLSFNIRSWVRINSKSFVICKEHMFRCTA